MYSYATETLENYAPLAPLADQNILTKIQAPKDPFLSQAKASWPTDYNQVDKYRKLQPTNRGIQDRDSAVVEIQKSQLKTSVDGAIVRIDDNSIRCELFTLPKARFINIPASFFNGNEIRVGLSITLRIDEIAGRRKPVVKLRNPVQEKLHEGSEFFDKIQF
jgi:hypothetical protein